VSRSEERLAASRAVGRVIRSGAWSNVVARTEASAEGATLPIVQGLAFAVLRMRPLIDASIERAARRPLDQIDPPVLDLLRVATAEIVEGRTPVELVVDGSVHAVRRVAPRATGFANAVLRRLAAAPPGPATLADIGVPDFADAALRHIMPPTEVDALWFACQESAPVAVRGAVPPPGAIAIEGIPGAWVCAPGEVAPDMAVQDPASVAVGNALDAPEGGLVLDMAAAPGGKTAHLLEQVGPEGTVIASDRHPRRVRDARRRHPSAHWVIADGTRPPFPESTFDAVLVDAPCTGLGTLRRRPEIRERVTPEGMAALAVTQRAMLEHALRLVRPGGRVVYSVCTFTPAETIDVVAGLGGSPPSGLPGHVFGDGWLMAPHLGPTDGMFVAVFDV
jgi:16S rRNA (cytosine967-C5)-methyltransferase